MSPSGRVPFIKCGAFVVSELEPIVQFAANKGVTLCSKLSTEEKAEMRAYMSLITNVLLYISWIDNDTYNAVTKVRNSSVYPWPLGWLQTRAKRNAVAKRLKALHWYDKTLEQVLADVEQCCNSLSQRLGDRDYFFGNTPTALDALVFGHIRALLSANGPKAALMIKPITTSLLKHVVHMVHFTGVQLTFGHIRALLSANGPKAALMIKPITTSLLKHVVRMVHFTGVQMTFGHIRALLSANGPKAALMIKPITTSLLKHVAQEEYLVMQAFQMTRRRLSPVRSASERSARVRRSRLPTELDALVFGHVFTIITTRLPCRRLAETVRRHDTLVSLAKRIDEQYFKRA
ncbi:Metaxin-2, partial [Operophtera brumata]